MKPGKTGNAAHLRSELSAAGSFVAIPDAFTTADKSVRNAVKFECRTVFSEEHRLQTLFATDRVLIDFASVDPSTLDFRKLAADCDLLKEIALKHADDVKECLTSLQKGGVEDVQHAEKIAGKIGLNEEHFVKGGGGLFFLVIVAAVALGAGGCGTLNSNKPFKQPTTPKPSTPRDAGPQDGGPQ